MSEWPPAHMDARTPIGTDGAGGELNRGFGDGQGRQKEESRWPFAGTYVIARLMP